MANQIKEVSKFATSYKRRSGGVDKRALRGLNRTLEQKEKRNENVNRRRTMYSTDDSLRDIEEEPEVEAHVPEVKEKTKTKAESRKEMLERWRKEKELKKKLETQKQKKPGFKVFHVPDTAAERKITQKLAPVKHVAAAPKVSTKPVSTKPTKTEPTRRVTRASAKPVPPTTEKTKTATKKETTTTGRQRHVSGGTGKTGNVEGRQSVFVPAKKSAPVTTAKRTMEPTRATRSTAGKSTAATKKTTGDQSRGATSRTTRSTATKSSTVGPKAVQKGKGTTTTTKKDKKSVPELVIDLENTPHVTRSRGETDASSDPHNASLTFPASKFQFKAPDNLTPYEFTPLSPGSAAGFLFPAPNTSAFNFSFSRSPSLKSRRCSTPKVSDLMKKPVLSSPAASIIKEVDSTDSEPENDSKRRKSGTVGNVNVPQIQVELPSDTTVSSDETTEKGNRSHEQDTKIEGTLAVSDVDTMFVTAAEVPDDTKMEVDQAPPARRRSTRRSTSSSDSASETLNELSKKSTPGRRRSTRRSVTPAVETIAEKEEDMPAEKSHKNSESDVTEKEAKPPSTPGRRRSTRRLISSTEESDLSSVESQSETASSTSGAVAEKTPSRKRRRSTRKSLAVAATPRLSDIPEPITEVEHEEKVESKSEVTEDSNSQLNSSVDDSSRKKNVVLVDNIVINSSEKESTPANRVKPSSDDVIFRTPASVPSNRRALSARRKTTAGANVAVELSHSASKQTPRSLNRCSLVLKTLSPEEGVEVLMKSPMIEMERKRKTPKTPRTPGYTGRIEPIDFDELDESLNSSQSSGVSSSQEPVTETLGPVSMETDKNFDGSAIQDSGISSAAVTPSTEEKISISTAESTDKQKKSDTDAGESEESHGVPFFRSLVSTTVSKLNTLSEKWDEVSKTDTRLTEELHDRVRMTTGQAQLLISKKGRFTQFANLVDDCEFQRGEQKTTCADLQGFWEMVNFQIEDVYTKFEELTKLRENNWEEKKELPKAQLKKKIIKKKPTATKPATSRPSAKSKFAEFRAKMKQQQEKKVEETIAEPESEKVKTFEGGFFQVNSPVKTEIDASRKSLISSVARSTSKPPTPKRFSKSPSCASPLLLHVISRRSRSIGGAVISSALSTEVGNTTGSPSATSKMQTANTMGTPVQSAIVSGSIFTPDSPAVRSARETCNSTPKTAGGSIRRSKRLSTKITETPIEVAEDSPGALLKYLMPSNTLNTDNEAMDTDTKSPDDVEMSANMKRGLLSEFDKSCNRKSISFAASPAARGSVCKSASERRRSSIGRSRRSVHFNLSSADIALDAQLHTTAPTTPFNKDSLLPRRRTHSGRRSSSSEHKENLLFTPPTTIFSPRVPVSESPATRMSKLTFDPNSPMNTIFTPPSVPSKQSTSEPAVATLIDLNFSPEEPQTDGAGHQVTETSGSSDRRISLL